MDKLQMSWKVDLYTLEQVSDNKPRQSDQGMSYAKYVKHKQKYKKIRITVMKNENAKLMQLQDYCC